MALTQADRQNHINVLERMILMLGFLCPNFTFKKKGWDTYLASGASAVFTKSAGKKGRTWNASVFKGLVDFEFSGNTPESLVGQELDLWVQFAAGRQDPSGWSDSKKKSEALKEAKEFLYKDHASAKPATYREIKSTTPNADVTAFLALAGKMLKKYSDVTGFVHSHKRAGRVVRIEKASDLNDLTIFKGTRLIFKTQALFDNADAALKAKLADPIVKIATSNYTPDMDDD